MDKNTLIGEIRSLEDLSEEKKIYIKSSLKK